MQQKVFVSGFFESPGMYPAILVLENGQVQKINRLCGGVEREFDGRVTGVEVGFKLFKFRSGAGEDEKYVVHKPPP